MPKFKDFHLTDLLYGICSYIPNSNGLHYFLADFDNESPKEIMGRAGKILIEKYRFGHLYLIKSGKGYHIVSFSKKLTINKYIKILNEMDADRRFTWWVKKTKYGIVRLSRRSSHMKVPKLVAVLKSPYHKWEDTFARDYYLHILRLEDKIKTVKRVKVFGRKHDS
jgi:hypothetical protein